MIGLFQGLITLLWLYLSTLFTWLGVSFNVFFSAFWDILTTWLTAGWDYLFQYVQGSQFADFLSQPWVTSDLTSSISLVAYFIPVKSSVIVFVTGLLLAGAIRLARWIKSFIPLIGD